MSSGLFEDWRQRCCTRYVKPLERAIDKGDHVAMNLYACFLTDGVEGVDLNPARALGLYERAIELGQPDAIGNLACVLTSLSFALEYESVEQDPSRAVELFQRATHVSDARAAETFAEPMRHRRE